ncbi:MAG: hypothetical protein ABIY71_09845 [Flavobacteriales bacterium]
MREQIQSLSHMLAEFEAWFDLRFGWFFTNGMKHRSVQSTEPDDPASESASPIS